MIEGIRTAIVTGVSKGIGLATVKLLLEEGYRVAGWGRTAPEISEEYFRFFETDVRDFESVNAAYADTKAWAGGFVSYLINNAGLGFEGPMHEMAHDQWHLMFDTNVHGIFYCSKVIIPDLIQNETGHIINISSIAGNTGIQGMVGYCGTKFAVRGISQSLFKELRQYGIKVTCIYPGSVKTNFFDSIDSVTVNDDMMMPEDIAGTILHCLESSPNYHHVDIEVRPLRAGKRK